MRLFQHHAVIGILAIEFLLSGAAKADVYVRSYTRKDGTRVKGHYRSDPDGKFGNNWSTYGNVNPHTGKRGWIRQPPNGHGSAYRFPVPELSYATGRMQPTSPETSPDENRGEIILNAIDYTDEEKAASKLRLARACIERQRVDAAQIWLKQIITEFPKTNTASEAKRILAAL